MKKLMLLSIVLIFSVALIASNQSQNAAPAQQQVNAAQKVADAILSDEFIKSLVTLAQESQMPIKDFVRSTFKVSNLSKEQLETINTEVKALCDLYPKVALLSVRCAQEKDLKWVECLKKNFADEISQNKCFIYKGPRDESILGLKESVTESEAQKMLDKVKAILVPFNQELEKSSLAVEYKAAQKELEKTIQKFNEIIPAIGQSINAMIQENQEQLKVIGIEMLAALGKGVSETVNKAVNECIQELKA